MGWNRWSIATKILVPFLALSVISIAILVYVALNYIDDLGDYAQASSTLLGNTAIKDSTTQLDSLGEEIVAQKAQDVGKQVEMYLAYASLTTDEQIKNDPELRQIVVQPVGQTGYTTLIDPSSMTILIHKYPEQEKDISPLQEKLPSFWSLIEASKHGVVVDGYYNWQEVDGSINEKYASIVPVNTPDGRLLTLWATTYIQEFSHPAQVTEEEINKAILESGDYISGVVSRSQKIFILIFVVLVAVITFLALALSRAITRPILSLQKGAEAVGRGKLDYALKLKSQDELGSLAGSFNKMSADLKKYIEELKNTSAENIAKERIIQDNLHLYVQKITEAQENERKRIARELHDDTIQELVVLSRHLEELAASNAGPSVEKIQAEAREILRGVRRFSQELRPSVLDDLGLIPAVQWLAGETTKNYGIIVNVEVVGSRERQLPEESELTLFRIIQEALTNVRKHSQATETLVRVEFSADQVRIVVSDNGIGFDLPEGWDDLARTGKLGLVGIQERVQLLGGSINVAGRPGQGTILTVEIPLNGPISSR